MRAPRLDRLSGRASRLSFVTLCPLQNGGKAGAVGPGLPCIAGQLVRRRSVMTTLMTAHRRSPATPGFRVSPPVTPVAVKRREGRKPGRLGGQPVSVSHGQGTLFTTIIGDTAGKGSAKTPQLPTALWPRHLLTPAPRLLLAPDRALPKTCRYMRGGRTDAGATPPRRREGRILLACGRAVG